MCTRNYAQNNILMLQILICNQDKTSARMKSILMENQGQKQFQRDDFLLIIASMPLFV